jgi:hypothetical protein
MTLFLLIILLTILLIILLISYWETLISYSQYEVKGALGCVVVGLRWPFLTGRILKVSQLHHKCPRDL